MVAISFSGEPIRGPFWKLIQKGEKNQTIRFPRKYPINRGDPLTLYWKQRAPIKLKPIHLIGKTTCISCEHTRLGDIWESEENAYADGFKNLIEFREWFNDIPLETIIWIIKWEPLR